MTMLSNSADQPSETTPRRWRKRVLVLFLSATALVIAGLSIWSLMGSLPVLADKTAHFAAVMRVVRPIILLIALMLWRPVFTWLHKQSWVSPQTRVKAIAVWPRLAIWIGLIELTLGQGYVLTGLSAMAVYWLFLRHQ